MSAPDAHEAPPPTGSGLLSKPLAHWNWFKVLSKRYGLRGALAYRAEHILAKHFGRKRHPVRVRAPGLPHPVWLRTGISSDPEVFTYTFLWNQYDKACELQNVKTIVDCGANSGYVSALFLSRHPQARILCVEPDPENAALCRRNLAPYGRHRFEVIEGAVWGSRTNLALLAGCATDDREWSRMVSAPSPDAPASAASVPGFTMPDLIERAGGSVDLLKMDIEWAELDVFRDPADWCRSVANIAIELHDSQCRETFFRSLQDFEFEISETWEITMCSNIRPRPHFVR